MKRNYKILKITAILIFTVIILLFLVSLMMQNKVAGLLLKTVNRNFQTRIEAGSYRLSLLKRFPRATIELKNVLVHSSPTFDKSVFGAMNTDTLLYARSAMLDFRMSDLLRGEYTFEGIMVKSGRLTLYTDTSGHYNYVIAKQNGKSENSHYSLNLNRIILSNVEVLYHDLNLRLIVKVLVSNSKAKSRITEKEIDFEGPIDTEFRYFRLKNYIIAWPFEARLDVGVNRNKKGYFFRKSVMHLKEGNLVLNGYIASDNFFDIIITGNGMDFSGIRKYLPSVYSDRISEFRPAGEIDLSYAVKGKSSKRVDPHYDLKFSLKNGHVGRPGSGLKIGNLSFSGAYTNGTQNIPLTSTLTLNTFAAKLGSGRYTGSFRLTDFTRPYASLLFKGTLYPEELREFLNISKISSAEGTIDLDINLSGLFQKKSHYTLSDLLEVDSRSEITFNGFGLKLAGRPVEIKNAGGKVAFSKTTSATNFTFDLNGQKIRLDCSLSNFPGWIAGRNVNLAGSATVFATCLKPALFYTTPESRSGKASKAPLNLPRFMDLEVNYNIDTLLYKTFRAAKIKGKMSLKPHSVNFRNISLSSQKGLISGNGLVVQNPDKSFIGRGSFIVSGVDVNEAFLTFHNFGQNFLKAGNIAGSLSGSLTLVLPVDSLLKPRMNQLTAEGNYLLADGALINFEPVKALSAFIELSELENIKFDKLENNFFIKNNNFYLPQMEVRSSAADLSVNGKHSFDNKYEYHVKMLLSQILSNKARRNRSLSSEFGEVEDDGLGRTSVFLKVAGQGEDVKVSYDLKAAGDQVKNDIRKEKQNLKGILNEEYGWYGSDTAAVKKQPPRHRFRVSWEGSDTASPESERPAVKKEGILKKIFKKKY
jgi:hypothetical protein